MEAAYGTVSRVYHWESGEMVEEKEDAEWTESVTSGERKRTVNKKTLNGNVPQQRDELEIENMQNMKVE